MDFIKKQVGRVVGAGAGGFAAWLSSLCVDGTCAVLPEGTTEALQQGGEGVLLAVGLMVYAVVHSWIDNILDRKK